MKYFVYVLRSQKDRKRYVGYTNDIERRLRQHHRGLVGSTADRRPLTVEYVVEHENKEDALIQEKYFKTAAGRRSLDKMVQSR